MTNANRRLRRISPAMLAHLEFISAVDAAAAKPGPGGRILGATRPTHAANIRTHEALERRGMLETDHAGYTHLTQAGREAIKAE